MTIYNYLFIILEECHIYDERPTDPIFPNNLLEKCAEDIAHSEQYSGLPNDCQYNESSGAELAKQMKGNYFSLFNLFRDSYPCSQVNWVDRVEILPPSPSSTPYPSSWIRI